MRLLPICLAALIILSFGMEDISAGDFRPGGFLLGRIAMKRIKKMRERENFSGHDSNKDGALDQGEIVKAEERHGEFIDDETFKRIDSNHDGMISHEECEAHAKLVEAAERAEAGAEGEPLDNRIKD